MLTETSKMHNFYAHAPTFLLRKKVCKSTEGRKIALKLVYISTLVPALFAHFFLDPY